MDLEAHAVPEPVPEVLPVALGGDQVARDRVDLAPVGPGRTASERGLLRARTSS